jgi:hypothetical protein
MNRTDTARAVAAALAAGVALAAVGTVAVLEHRSTHHVSAAGDTIELQALSDVQNGSAAPSGSPSGRPGQRGPRGFGPRGGFGALGGLGGGVLHGDVVVQGPDGKPVTVAVQRGTVTSVGGGRLVVRSSDGFVETWNTATTTQYGLPQLMRPGGHALAPGREVGPSAAPSTSAPAATVTKGATVYVLGRVQGTGTPTARLVISTPNGFGTGRLRPAAPRLHWGPEPSPSVSPSAQPSHSAPAAPTGVDT